MVPEITEYIRRSWQFHCTTQSVWLCTPSVHTTLWL